LDNLKNLELSIDRNVAFSNRVRLDLLRLDQVHPSISGNKWFKLKYNLSRARQQRHDTLLTFGGAFSNHIHATAAAGKAFGFKTVGIIRGEQPSPLNPTLAFATSQGMQLKFVSRQTYSQKNQKKFREELTQQFGSCFVLPEGGSNALAVQGCAEILPQDHSYQYIACCIGTGGTLAGILEANQERAKVLGFSALKAGNFLSEEIKRLNYSYNKKVYQNFTIIEDYHFGGYAKATEDLVDFINAFKKRHNILLDPIYTGKMMYGLWDMMQTGYFPKGSHVLAIHSGGLQGIEGFNARYQKKNYYILID